MTEIRVVVQWIASADLFLSTSWIVDRSVAGKA
jgi:hypothetical protein